MAQEEGQRLALSGAPREQGPGTEGQQARQVEQEGLIGREVDRWAHVAAGGWGGLRVAE